MSKEVLSLACGQQIYFDMAATLARSFRWHHRDSDIAFTIATDDPTKIPADVAAWTRIHLIEDRSKVGFELKLSLDRYARAEQTLFIDADCLVTRNLTEVFDELSGHAVTALGKNVAEGEWFGDLANRATAIGSDFIPVFVGALYYFEKGDLRDAVFNIARAYADRYDELEIVRLRGRKNEEPLISIGLAKNGLKVLPDDGRFKGDVMGFDGPVSVNVLTGSVSFQSPKKDILLAPECQGAASPAIAHFNDAYTSLWQYRKEAHRLYALLAKNQPPALAALSSFLTVELPGRLTSWGKETFRPLYHRLFGVRKRQQNERVS